MDIRRRTTDYLRQKAEKKMYPGKVVKIEYWTTENGEQSVLRGRKKAVVEWCSGYIFGVKIGGHKECFRYNQVFGNENIKIRV